jgi:hypothetical protein
MYFESLVAVAAALRYTKPASAGSLHFFFPPAVKHFLLYTRGLLCRPYKYLISFEIIYRHASELLS